MLTFKGTVKLLFDPQQVNEKFRKREFVLTETGSPYPQEILFQAVQERVDLLNDVQAGDEIEVSFNLRGRAWTNPRDGVTRYFNSLDVWKITKGAQGGGAVQHQQTNEKPMADVTVDTSVDDDLPF